MGLDIVFIGAGNLATHLALALKQSGNRIVQVFSRTAESAKMLAGKVDSDYTNTIEEITGHADIFFIAVKDSVFADLLPGINFGNRLVVHCSGSLPVSVLKDYTPNYGVLYPLQTFSRNRDVDFQKIPVFIEASSPENENILLKLAGNISKNVSLLGSEKRMHLHIAAVFACNFVNHCYTLASEVLQTKEIPFDVLKPLIEETAAKVQSMPPYEAQTGPAVRYDENILSKHEDKLHGLNNYAKLYRILSDSIFAHHQNKE